MLPGRFGVHAGRRSSASAASIVRQRRQRLPGRPGTPSGRAPSIAAAFADDGGDRLAAKAHLAARRTPAGRRRAGSTPKQSLPPARRAAVSTAHDARMCRRRRRRDRRAEARAVRAASARRAAAAHPSAPRRRRRCRVPSTLRQPSSRTMRVPDGLGRPPASSARRHRRRESMHGRDDLAIAGAAAEHAAERVHDLGLGRLGLALQQRRRRDQHAGRADAALRGAMAQEGVLQRAASWRRRSTGPRSSARRCPSS